MCAGVRKHARKTHLAWLKSVDETAGNRDRHLESKPSTYCIKEEDDNPDIEIETSPMLTPTMNGLSMGGEGAGPSELRMPMPALSLPDAAAMNMPLSAAVQQQAINGAVAAAAAAALINGVGVNAQTAPPLAWLLAQNAMNNATLGTMNIGSGEQQQQHNVPTAGLVAPPVSLPVNLGGTLGGLPPMPPWMGAAAASMDLPQNGGAMPAPSLGGADPRLGFDPLPTPNWAMTPGPLGDLSTLFGNQLAERAGLGAPAEGGDDPLCLTPPTASAISSTCVSPFELEKRPQKPPSALGAPMKDPTGPPSTVQSSPVSTTTPFDQEDDFFPVPDEAEYKAFVETLLAV